MWVFILHKENLHTMGYRDFRLAASKSYEKIPTVPETGGIGKLGVQPGTWGKYLHF